MIVPHYYEDLHILHENTMPARAYYVPASGRMDDPVEHREQSDRLQLLNGNWRFRYFKSIYDVNEEFYNMEYDCSGFDEIAVPGTWQMAGYDTHQYTNIRYPFPFDPPYVPQDVPCGAYVHTFDYQQEEKAPKVFLNFEGVDSCFYVWLNGVYVGYSQVAHGMSEFDVTAQIREGRNTLAVLNLKWCDGSYLEDQDKFRMSGIFRDVYLLKRPAQAIRDYHITTEIIGDTEKTAIVRLELMMAQAMAEPQVEIRIENAAGRVVAEGWSDTHGVAELKITNPQLWNTENPYLYTVILRTEAETITEWLVLRTIEIRDGVIYLNGQKIKFRGVNRHDSDPYTGPVTNVEQIRTDLRLMKQHNLNAIRSSHYPNAPYFYQMCEKYGFLVINEADIEAHGPFMLYRQEDTEQNRFQRWNEAIADNPAWEAAILDRVQQMVERDKNRFCIVIWSMGNESAYGCNFEKALAWTKAFDPYRITQYESARYRNDKKTYHYENLDLYSRMYPALSEIREYLDRGERKPFLLVEYCHSMGNGPGDLEDYFRMIQSDDRMCGGFVWEWCDHAIAEGYSENGKVRYLYGGDHGESIHDGNFCVDGLVYPDRRLHTGLLEYKNVYRPARVVTYEQESGRLVLHNYMDFDNLEDYAEIAYEVTLDGVVIRSGKLETISVAPHRDGQTQLRPDVPQAGQVYLRLIYRLKKRIPLMEPGQILGFDEIRLQNADDRNQRADRRIAELNQETTEMNVRETDRSIVLESDAFTYEIDKRTGMFTKLQVGGRDCLTHPMELNIWRAPTDNDMYRKEIWRKAHYHEVAAWAYQTEIRREEGSVLVHSTAAIVAPTVQRIMDVELTWEIAPDGKIHAHITGNKNPEFPELPRFGVRMFLNKQADQVTYYGMGPQESYCDKHQGAGHGWYRASVEEMHEDYIRPQENGSHYDCDYVEVADGQTGLAATGRAFSVNVSPYTQEELERTAHNYDLTEADSTILCLDYALNGIGSNSCGPEVAEPYRLDGENIDFWFTLVPFNRERRWKD